MNNYKENMFQEKEIDELINPSDDFFEDFEDDDKQLTIEDRLRRAVVVYNYSGQDVEDVALLFDLDVEVLKERLK